MFARLTALLVVLAAGVVLANDGHFAGRWDWRQFDIGTKAAPVSALAPFHARVTFPTRCSSQCGEFRTGGMPVFLFVCGFAGQIDAFNYDTIASGIARHGIIVVAVDRTPGNSLTLDYGKLGVQFQKVIAWIRLNDPAAGLAYELSQNGFTQSLLNGANRIIMGGHTTGAALVVRNIRDNAKLSETCTEVGAVVMLSPLDGQDPLGFGGDGAIEKDKMLPFSTPSLIIGGSLDPKSPPALQGLPCTPADRSNKHFYDAWSGSSTFLEVDGVGTLDVLTEGSVTSFEGSCLRSATNQVAYRKFYRDSVRGAIVNFIQSVVLNSADYANLVSRFQPNTAILSQTAVKGVGRAFTCQFVSVVEPMPFELQTGLILFGFLFALTFITGLYLFFRKMDDDTLHRYHPAEGMGYDEPASFQTKLEPQYGVSQSYQQQNSVAYSQGGNSRAPSINV